MRASAWLTGSLLLSSLAMGCTAETNVIDDEPPPTTTPAVAPPTSAPPVEPATPTVAPPTPATVTTTGEYAEVVSLQMRGNLNSRWFCTATLVARDRVVTAAHCLDKQFWSYEITASFVAGKPRIKAKRPEAFGGDFAMVENPDIGILELETPLDLPHYGELTNVVDLLAQSPTASVTGAAVVRTEERPDATMAMSAQMPVSSTEEYGYAHGIGTPLFSKGGDSGAGLFLVENGVPTHKLIGVARQPEPEREIDHFTRIDADFLAWYAR